MKITNVSISNFLTVGEDPIKINLDNKGMVLITGENRDDTSAISNGAGKSTIGDAICWALYGETARGETGDAIINKTNAKNCCVEVLVDDDGVIYSIARYRKEKTYKNGLYVHNMTTITDVTKGTDKLTQELVNGILGCSLEVFRSAIYAAQDSIPNLPGMTDKNLKEIVEEAAGINRLAAAHVIAKDDLKVAELNLSKVESNLKATLDRIQIIEDELPAAKAKRDNFAAENQVKIDTAQSYIDGYKISRQSMMKDPGLLSDADVAASKNSLEDLKRELDRFIANKDAASAEMTKADREYFKVEAAFKTAIAKAKNDLDNLQKIKSRVGQPCGECGKEYHEEDLDSATEIAKKIFGDSKKVAEALKADVVAAKSAHSAAAAAHASLGDLSAAIKSNQVIADALRADLKRSDFIKADIKNIESKIEAEEKRITELTSAENPHEAIVDKMLVDLAGLKAEKNLQERGVAGGVEKRDLAADAVKVFSPAGVRAHVIDTVTPLLNDRTSHYLSTLSDGNINATWNTLSKTKTGELREKFIIDVTNDKGAANFGGLSGGEKRKVRIATALALQDLVASRAIKPIELFIADEIDDALDDAGLERLMMLLEEKSREKGTVLMISHNSLGDWCNQQATVIKENGFSRMEGYLNA